MIIRVRVIDAARKPIAGAAVYVATSPGPAPDIAQLTDDNGIAVVAAPAAGEYYIVQNAFQPWKKITGPADPMD